jgi:hypothetical protein
MIERAAQKQYYVIETKSRTSDDRMYVTRKYNRHTGCMLSRKLEKAMHFSDKDAADRYIDNLADTEHKLTDPVIRTVNVELSVKDDEHENMTEPEPETYKTQSIYAVSKHDLDINGKPVRLWFTGQFAQSSGWLWSLDWKNAKTFYSEYAAAIFIRQCNSQSDITRRIKNSDVTEIGIEIKTKDIDIQ